MWSCRCTKASSIFTNPSDSRFESLVFRQRIQHDVEISDLQQQLLLNAPSSAYQKMKGAKLGADTMVAIHCQDFIPSSYTIQSLSQLFGTLRESALDLLNRYCTLFDKSDYHQDFPELLVNCLDHSMKSVCRACELNSEKQLKPKWKDIDEVLSNADAGCLSEKIHEYLDHCHRDGCTFEDANFGSFKKLAQRMHWFRQMETELERTSSWAKSASVDG